MKLYSIPNSSLKAFQIIDADDGVWLEDVQCTGNSQATAALLPGISSDPGPDIRKIEVIATWVDAANFAVSLGYCPPRACVEVWAKGGSVTVFPDQLGLGAVFGDGSASIVVPVGTGKIFKNVGTAVSPIWNYVA